MTPIWKDTIYNYSADTINYIIEREGLVLYQGKAYKFPDAESGTILTNKICKEYLYQDFPNLSGTTVHSGMTGEFNLVDESGNTLGTYDFIDDWNYDDSPYSADTNLNIPINAHYATNMYVFSTNYISASGLVQTTAERAQNPAFCGKYAVYYTNRKNGWDSFLFEGAVIKEKDSFEQYSYDRFVSTEERNRKGEKVRYKNIIKKSFTLNTGWLNDAESKVLSRHLFSSNDIYLHNLETDEVVPATILDTEVEYKRYRNERKLVSYEINIEIGNKEELA